MYLAEFAFCGTKELADELLIQTASESAAKQFAQEYAQHWGIELFALTPADKQRLMPELASHSQTPQLHECS
jgi:hypothetical protein